MTTATDDFHPGNLVRARNREWVVQASDNRQSEGPNVLRLRPLGGADEDIITLIPALEFAPVEPATFAWPNPDQAWQPCRRFAFARCFAPDAARWGLAIPLVRQHRR